jgi:hypothetical protein
MKNDQQPRRGNACVQRIMRAGAPILGILAIGAGLQIQAQQPAGTYNVQTDGTAQGDGVSDDTVELQAALSSAVLQGKDVYFPSGTYMVTGQLDIPTGTSLYGDKSGLSLIKSASPVVTIGEPDNDGTSVANLSVEDMFFLNVALILTGTQKDNIAVRRCVFATDQVHSQNWFMCILSRGDNNTIEDSIFMAGHDTGMWPGTFIKGIGTYRNNGMTLRRNIFGLDLGNLTWLDTEWAGYANWHSVVARLQQFRNVHGLPRRMGAMGGGMRLNECNGTVVDQCIFHMDPVATDVPQDNNNLNVPPTHTRRRSQASRHGRPGGDRRQLLQRHAAHRLHV